MTKQYRRLVNVADVALVTMMVIFGLNALYSAAHADGGGFAIGLIGVALCGALVWAFDDSDSTR